MKIKEIIAKGVLEKEISGKTLTDHARFEVSQIEIIFEDDSSETKTGAIDIADLFGKKVCSGKFYSIPLKITKLSRKNEKEELELILKRKEKILWGGESHEINKFIYIK